MVLPGGSGDAVWASPLGRGLRCEGDFRGASRCWRLAPLSLTGRAPWEPLLWPQVLLLPAGPVHPAGLGVRLSQAPSRALSRPFTPDCSDCAPRGGTRFLSGKLLQASPPRWGTPGPLGSWDEVLPHPPPGPTPQGPAGSPSKPRRPESGATEAARGGGPPFVRMPGAPFWPGLPRWLGGDESTCNAQDTGSVPGSERCPGGGNGYPLQYSCLENPVDRGAWRATARGVSSQTRLGTHAHPV